MATSSGPWQSYARIEWVYSVGAASAGSSSVPVTATAYLRMDGGHSTAGTWPKSWSGAWGSGSGSQYISLGFNARVQVMTGSASVSLTDSAQTVYFSASVAHNWGSTGSTLSVSIPAKPPSAPSGVAVSRVSDVQHVLNWTRNSVYTAVIVQRSTNGSTWSQVGRPTGNAYGFTDTSTVANQRYFYRVAGVSAGGQSAWSAVAGPVYTSPAAPSGVAAARSGSSIVVSAAGTPAYAASYDVEDGGVSVASSVSLPWTHLAPSTGVSHTYRVRGKVGTVLGAWSAVSNTVNLLAAPNAPTGLAPNGGVAASDSVIRFSWRHNPVDASPQSVYELQHRLPGGAWVTLSGTSAQFRDVSLAAGVREWQVRTKGSHASWSPYSTVATVNAITRPGVAAQVPPVWDRPTLLAEWTWLQDEGRPQSAWRVELLDGFGERVESREGSGPDVSVALTTRLGDGGEYTLRVQAATGEVWSEWGAQTFTVTFVPPEPAAVDAAWDESLGAMSLSVSVGSPGPGVPETVSVVIERSVDDGLSWEPVLSADGGDLAVTDWESLSGGVTIYRVVTVADTGAESVVDVPVVADSGAVWLSGGVSFERTARLLHSPKVSVSGGRARSVERYEGRPYGVAYAGEQLSRTVDVSGMILEDDTDTAQVEQFTALAQDPAPVHMYRDPDGRRIYGAIGNVSLPREFDGVWGYGFQLEETGR